MTTGEVSGIKTLSESELADAQWVLDGTARERARLQIEIRKVQAKLEEARKNAKKQKGKVTVAQGRVKDLESLFYISDAELTIALGDKHGLETEVAELRAQLTKVGWSRCGQGAAGEGDADARSWRTAARACRRSWLSARVCLRRRCENPMEARATLGGGGQQPAQEYGFKMAQAPEDPQSQHEEQVHLYQLDLEQPYRAKLDNAKPSSKQNDKAASAAPEELKEAHVLLGVPQLPQRTTSTSWRRPWLGNVTSSVRCWTPGRRRRQRCATPCSSSWQSTSSSWNQAGPGHGEKHLQQAAGGLGGED